jgi:hypothetical protein
MFTPSGTASTARLARRAATAPARRLLTRFASTDANAAMPNKAASPGPSGTSCPNPASRPVVEGRTARETTRHIGRHHEQLPATPRTPYGGEEHSLYSLRSTGWQVYSRHGLDLTDLGEEVGSRVEAVSDEIFESTCGVNHEDKSLALVREQP